MLLGNFLKTSCKQQSLFRLPRIWYTEILSQKGTLCTWPDFLQKTIMETTQVPDTDIQYHF